MSDVALVLEHQTARGAFATELDRLAMWLDLIMIMDCSEG